jgi:hypothetical protein
MAMQGNSCVEAMVFSDDNPLRDKISANIIAAMADNNDAATLEHQHGMHLRNVDMNDW